MKRKHHFCMIFDHLIYDSRSPYSIVFISRHKKYHRNTKYLKKKKTILNIRNVSFNICRTCNKLMEIMLIWLSAIPSFLFQSVSKGSSSLFWQLDTNAYTLSYEHDCYSLWSDANILEYQSKSLRWSSMSLTSHVLLITLDYKSC